MSKRPRYTFHLIPNAHLDPVWLWDWREGLNEGLITCRTILDLMDEDPDLTFIRGEAAIYQHVERTDPKTFARIAKYVKQGRWDVVGGTVIQPDTNLPDTETFARHFLHGQRYFASRFGKPVRCAWAADSFGHAAGLPEVLAAAGIESFAFSRPAPNVVPIEKPAFWWEGPGSSRVLAYRMSVGWYGAERHEIPERFDAYLKAAEAGDLHNVGAFFGLGNHGGGPTRRQIEDVRRWAEQHPDVRVVFSGLHALFDAINKEVRKQPRDFLPVHKGELNFVLRGCYSSVAKFKFLYRKTEAALARAEKTNTTIVAATKTEPADLRGAWDGVLFNSFHDILPGTSIERAFDDQIAWLGGALHVTQWAELDALNALASRIDTTVETPDGDMPAGVAMLVWNPLPYPVTQFVELEASLDYRPIWKYHQKVDELPVRVKGADGAELPFQVIETEHHSMVELAWRKRVLVPLTLPPLGWNVVEMAYREDVPPATLATQVSASDDGVIDDGVYRVEAKPGDRGVRILRNGQSLFDGDGLLGAITVEDPWGSWGGMGEEHQSIDLSSVRHEWQVTQVAVLERGPLRATMWVKLEAGNSRLELSFFCSHGRPSVDVCARVLWNERSARLKLVFPVGDQAEFDVPGGTVARGPAGEVPGGKWVRVTGSRGAFGFASDALYNFDCRDGALRATVVRASRYADDVQTPPEHDPWRPAVDAGELKFRFLLSDGGPDLPQLAERLEQPPIALPVPPHEGKLGRSGSLASIEPADALRVLAIKPADDGRGVIVRVHNRAGRDVKPTLTWLGRRVPLPKVPDGRIATWRLRGKDKTLKAAATDITEGAL